MIRTPHRVKKSGVRLDHRTIKTAVLLLLILTDVCLYLCTCTAVLLCCCIAVLFHYFIILPSIILMFIEPTILLLMLTILGLHMGDIEQLGLTLLLKLY